MVTKSVAGVAELPASNDFNGCDSSASKIKPAHTAGNPAECRTSRRCEVCNWPLAESQEHGCIPGDCSYRPDDPVEQSRIRLRRDELARLADDGGRAHD